MTIYVLSFEFQFALIIYQESLWQAIIIQNSDKLTSAKRRKKNYKKNCKARRNKAKKKKWIVSRALKIKNKSWGSSGEE